MSKAKTTECESNALPSDVEPSGAYDEDTSIKDGFKSIGWFFVAIIIFSVLGFIWYLIKNL